MPVSVGDWLMCHSNKKKDLPGARRFYEKRGKFDGVFFVMRCDSLLFFWQKNLQVCEKSCIFAVKTRMLH